MNVIFICTGNSARSQMAEGFAKYYGEKYKIADLNISSAGINPKPVNSLFMLIILSEIQSIFFIIRQSHDCTLIHTYSSKEFYFFSSIKSPLET
jgi:predicted protein tyrosine phosphatase